MKETHEEPTTVLGNQIYWHKCPKLNTLIAYSADDCPICNGTATPIEVGRDDKPF